MSPRNCYQTRFRGVLCPSNFTIVMLVVCQVPQSAAETKFRPSVAHSVDHIADFVRSEAVSERYLGDVTGNGDRAADGDSTGVGINRRMLDKLGSDYNPMWMSIDRPPELDSNDNVPPPRTRITVQPEVTKKLYRQLTKSVNFTILDPSTGVLHPLKPAVRKYLERWLLERASCPIRLVWNDLGALFWPRWVRQGECGDSKMAGYSTRSLADKDEDVDDDDDERSFVKSCSWPPGMRCVPETSRNIHLLRWHCRQHRHRTRSSRWSTSGDRTASAGGGQYPSDSSDHVTVLRQRGDSTVDGLRSDRRHVDYRSAPTAFSTTSKSDRMRCRWKKVPYPITSECFCSC